MQNPSILFFQANKPSPQSIEIKFYLLLHASKTEQIPYNGFTLFHLQTEDQIILTEQLDKTIY